MAGAVTLDSGFREARTGAAVSAMSPPLRTGPDLRVRRWKIKEVFAKERHYVTRDDGAASQAIPPGELHGGGQSAIVPASTRSPGRRVARPVGINGVGPLGWSRGGTVRVHRPIDQMTSARAYPESALFLTRRNWLGADSNISSHEESLALTPNAKKALRPLAILTRDILQDTWQTLFASAPDLGRLGTGL